MSTDENRAPESDSLKISNWANDIQKQDSSIPREEALRIAERWLQGWKRIDRQKSMNPSYYRLKHAFRRKNL